MEGSSARKQVQTKQLSYFYANKQFIVYFYGNNKFFSKINC